MSNTDKHSPVTIENLEKAKASLLDQGLEGAARAIQDLIDEVRLKLEEQNTKIG